MNFKNKLSKLTICTLVLFTSFFAFSQVFIKQINAAPGINRTINFQGKVVNKTGETNITNGSYSFTFKFYDAASGGTQLPSGAAWTETKNLTVTNGIFRTALGDTTSIPSTLDFNSDSIYLDMTFNGETFTTRIRMTSVPYAFNAEKVAGLTVTNTTGTLTIPNAKTISFSDAFTTTNAGAVTLTNNATGFSLQAGTTTPKTLTVSGTTILADNVMTFGGTQTLTLAAAKNVSFADAFSTSGAFATTLTSTGVTNVTLPTTGTLLTNSASANQTITSTQTSGTVLGVTDSTAITAAIKGAVITLSGTGGFDQTGLEFNLSGATGTNLNDVVGTGSTWKVSKSGAAVFTSIGATSPGTGAFTTLSSTGATTLGNNSTTVGIDSSVWDITTAGVVSGITGYTQASGAFSTTLTTTNKATFASSTSTSDTIQLAPFSTAGATFNGIITTEDLTVSDKTWTLPNVSGTVCISGQTCATSGTVGFWSRTGTSLSPSTAGDAITTTGNISATGSGTGSFAGTLTASNGLTLTTGALNLTATSGVLSLSGLGASSISTGANTLTLSSGGASAWTNTSGNLTISTATSGTLALTSAGALNFTGAAASTWSVGTGNALTLTSQNFRVASSGDVTITAGQKLDVIAAGALNVGTGTATSIAQGSSAVTQQTFVTDNNSASDIAITGGLSVTSANSALTLTSSQASGTVLGITDSTNITGAIKGQVITLSGGPGAFDQTGLEFNLSGATGTNLNDVVGTGSSWKVSKAGAAVFSSIGATSPGTGAFTTLSSTGVTTLGNNSATVAIDSSDWNITAVGDMTGIGALTMDGNFSQTGSTTFGTGSGAVSLNGATTVAANMNFALASGTGTFTQTYTGTGTATTKTADSLTSGSILSLTAATTGAAANTQKGLNIALSGTNATASQTTYGAYISNTHAGATSTNVGLYATATGATNNYAAIFENGNVGIGLTNPGTTLDVTGTGRFSSTLTASNGLTLTTGALNLTGTSGAISLAGLSASSISTGSNALTITSSNFNTTSTGINSTAIGATTRSTGAFTTLAANSTINFSALTASRALFLDASSNVVATGASVNLLNSLTDETGTGVVVFGTSPSITTSLITASTSFDLINTAATTVNFAGGATTALNIGSLTTGLNTFRADVDMTFGAGENLNITAGAAPTADLMTIANTGQGTVTTAIDGLQIDLVTAAVAGSVDNAGLRLTINPVGATEAGDTVEGIDIANITNPTGLASGLRIGTGWDAEIAFVDTATTFTIGNTGTLSITDGTNNLVQVIDMGTTGAFNVTGEFRINGTAGVDRDCNAGAYLGNMTTDGGIVTVGACENDGLSDARLKKNVESLGSALEKLRLVNPITFDFKCDDPQYANTGMDCYSGRQTGVIAQELAKIFPELVYQDEDGFYIVKYQGLSIYTLKAVTELAAKVDLLSNADGDDNFSEAIPGLKVDTIESFSGQEVSLKVSENGYVTIRDQNSEVSVQFDAKGNATFDGLVKAQKVEGLEVITAPKVTANEVALDKIQARTGQDIALHLTEEGKFIIKDENGEPAITFDADGNGTFKGTLTADKIKANQIEGLEFIESGIKNQELRIKDLESLLSASQSATAASSSADVIPSESSGQALSETKDLSNGDSSPSAQNDNNILTLSSLSVDGLATVSADLRVKGNSLVEGVLNVIDTLMAKNVMVSGVADFFANVIFRGDVEFRTHPTFSKDTAGTIIVKKDSQEIEVKFEKEYASLPIVNVNITIDKIDDEELQKELDEAIFNDNIKYLVTKRSAKGFTIKLNKKADIDLPFSWTALSVKDYLGAKE